MAAFNDGFDVRERIRDAIDIVDLVERYVPLRRQGANFVGKCPWHDDSHPSLQVNAARQTFKCWVCNIGGDVFSFVMRMENVDFMESMQILADMAGIELKRKPSISGVPQGRLTRPDNASIGAQFAPEEPDVSKQTMYVALEWLAGKYRNELLNSPEAEEARRYVRERGISDESSERFLLGYAPMNGGVLDWIGADRNRVRALERAGVLAYREEYDARGFVAPRPQFAPSPKLSYEELKKYYDRFRGRLIFPIRDVMNRVVAFGGRLLPNTTLKSPAKYVNSPETPIFHKSKMLYGLDQARVAIRKTNFVIATEGYTDCIMTSQFGFENVVAVLGTALGSEHAKILKRFASKIILLLDGDAPGQKRANEVLRFFVEQGADVRVLTLPNNDDPCEFLLEKGADAFKELLENKTVDALDQAFNAATKGIDLDSDVVGSARALDSLLDVVALFPDEIMKNVPARLRLLGALQRFATRFRVSEEEIRRQFVEKRARARSYAAKQAERESRRFEGDAKDDAPAGNNRRETLVYPIAGPENETDEQLRALYAPFEKSIWGDPRFMPGSLEREYLEFWLVAPSVYPTLVAKIDSDDLRSPIARQLDLVAREFLERGEEPTFEKIMLRYDDDAMKTYLVDLDASAVAKGLTEVAADENRRDDLARQIIDGFERLRADRDVPKKIGLLREKNVSPERRLQTLLELRRQQQEKQRKRAERDYPADA